MKIVFKANIKTNEHDNVIEGLASAAHACDFEVLKWDESMKPAYDMAYETKPDLVVCGGNEVTSSIVNASKEYGFKLVVINPTEIFAEEMLGYIHRPAADLVRYKKQEKNNDVVTIAEHDSLQLLHLQDLKLKCFSLKKSVVAPYYLGKLKPSQIPKEVSKSKVYLESNGSAEAMLNAVCSGTLPVALGMGISEDNVIETVEELKSYVKKMLNNDEERKFTVEQTYKKIIEKDTYFHRLYDIMTLADYEKEAEICVSSLEDLQ